MQERKKDCKCAFNLCFSTFLTIWYFCQYFCYSHLFINRNWETNKQYLFEGENKRYVCFFVFVFLLKLFNIFNNNININCININIFMWKLSCPVAPLYPKGRHYSGEESETCSRNNINELKYLLDIFPQIAQVTVLKTELYTVESVICVFFNAGFILY